MAGVEVEQYFKFKQIIFFPEELLTQKQYLFSIYSNGYAFPKEHNY